MRLHSYPARLAARLPRRTVRLRLTALYGGLFLACGVVLLAITNLLARSWPGPPFAVPATGQAPAAGAPAQGHGAGTTSAYRRQLSCVMPYVGDAGAFRK
jgi:hypothetical protein